MKKLLVTMLCMLPFFPAVAQNKVQWGMEVGVGMSAWMGKNADGSRPLFNPKVGVTLDIPLNWLVSFQTGLNWTSKGASYKMYNLKSATTRLYDTEAKIICIVSKKGAQCIECHHKDI